MPSLAAVSTGVSLSVLPGAAPAPAGSTRSVLLKTTTTGVLRSCELVEDAVLVLAPAAGLGDQHAEVGAVEDLHGALARAARRARRRRRCRRCR